MKLITKSLCLFILSFVISSCSKNRGCTDSIAQNYDSSKEEDNGLCAYRGSFVIYHTYFTTLRLLQDEIYYLRLFINGSFFKEIESTVDSNTTPKCEDYDGFAIKNFPLGGFKAKKVSFQIKDQDNNEIINGVVQVNANTCEALEFSY